MARGSGQQKRRQRRVTARAKESSTGVALVEIYNLGDTSSALKSRQGK